ncbi:MAG: polysaccharide deacetylase family protein [Sphaerochaetaceae bacterium]|nr:polysaccharide deacetylase family protein [Sphaerochaetaceae bacterium]
MLYLRFPAFKAKALTLSYDDGVQQDVQLASILDKAKLKATFNLNSGLYAKPGLVYEKGTIHRRMSKAEADALFQPSGHEVACHGLTHAFMTRLPDSQACYEALEDRKNLEKQFGRIIRGFAYPYGDCNAKLANTLRTMGFAYARTTVSTHSFELPQDPLLLNPTCHHNDPCLMKLAKEFLSMEVKRNAQLFYLWGHSYEAERDDSWSLLQGFADLVQGQDSIWYATNLQIIDYIESFRRLESSCDGMLLANPTSQDLFMISDDEPILIRSGQSIDLRRR